MVKKTDWLGRATHYVPPIILVPLFFIAFPLMIVAAFCLPPKWTGLHCMKTHEQCPYDKNKARSA
jgi:hypothetical protein